jgi:uracil-DNA glycosylase family 4
MLAAINLTFAQVYLASLVKCVSEKTQMPATEEFAACQPFILQQRDAVNPKALLVFGEKAAQLLLQSSQPIFHLRGRLHDYHGTPAVVTYHPNQLNSEPALKRLSWNDLQLLQKELCRQSR